METNTLHDLTAAYALDALDDEDARAYEAHLARCERCRDELSSFSETASALAYAVDAPVPPPELRARIIQQAARER
jgi:anti-sigma factor RsiW